MGEGGRREGGREGRDFIHGFSLIIAAWVLIKISVNIIASSFGSHQLNIRLRAGRIETRLIIATKACLYLDGRINAFMGQHNRVSKRAMSYKQM